MVHPERLTLAQSTAVLSAYVTAYYALVHLAGLRRGLKQLGQWDNTVVMTYSEFGRRAEENNSEGTDHGTGFKMYDLHAQAVFDTVGWAVHTWYQHPDQFRAMQLRGMGQRFSWERSAARYEEMYQEAILRKRGA